jgi:ABC-2 type transport system ATP-binding protein
LISVLDLSKEFDGIRALDGVSLHVERGETFGLIGPNGAGKTTLVRILTGQIAPSRGEIRLEGDRVDPREPRYRLKVGLVPQEAAFYGRLTACENLILLGQLYGLDKKEVTARVDYLLAWAGLREHAARQTRHFSSGMQQRLSLTMGLIHAPEIIYLDEPTSGLDPAARSSLWELINRLSEEGRAVFVTTHNMEEADHICARLAILVDGTVRGEGTPSQIKGLLGRDRIELRLTEDRGGDLDDLSRRLGFTWRADGDLIIISGGDLAAKLPEIVAGLAGSVRNLHYREVTLEDAFLRFMREVGD